MKRLALVLLVLVAVATATVLLVGLLALFLLFTSQGTDNPAQASGGTGNPPDHFRYRRRPHR